MKKISFILWAAILFTACSKDQFLDETQSPLDMASKAAAQGGQKFYTTLSGGQEVPGPGDPDGTGTFSMTINPGQSTITYTLIVSNIAPATAAHIHEAPFGVAGPAKITLLPPTSGISTATIEVPRELIDDIRKNPSDYYVNVHNAEFPAGAVRGQLSKSMMEN